MRCGLRVRLAPNTSDSVSLGCAALRVASSVGTGTLFRARYFNPASRETFGSASSRRKLHGVYWSVGYSKNLEGRL